jgi:hypothetical protein
MTKTSSGLSKTNLGINLIKTNKYILDVDYVDYVYDDKRQITSISKFSKTIDLGHISNRPQTSETSVYEMIAKKLEALTQKKATNNVKILMSDNLTHSDLERLETTIIENLNLLQNQVKLHSSYSLICSQKCYDNNSLNLLENVKSKVNIVINNYCTDDSLYLVRNNQVEFKNDVAGLYVYNIHDSYQFIELGFYPEMHLLKINIQRKLFNLFKNEEKLIPIFKNLFQLKIDAKGRLNSQEIAEIENQFYLISDDRNGQILNLRFNLNLDKNLKMIPLHSLEILFKGEFDISIQRHTKEGAIFLQNDYYGCKEYSEFDFYQNLFDLNFLDANIEELEIQLTYNKCKISFVEDIQEKLEAKKLDEFYEKSYQEQIKFENLIKEFNDLLNKLDTDNLDSNSTWLVNLLKNCKIKTELELYPNKFFMFLEDEFLFELEFNTMRFIYNYKSVFLKYHTIFDTDILEFEHRLKDLLTNLNLNVEITHDKDKYAEHLKTWSKCFNDI